MSAKDVLIINSTESACGVYQFGVNVYNLLYSAQSHYNWHISYCASAADVLRAVGSIKPHAIIFNYHPTTMPWVGLDLIKATKRLCIGIYHEITHEIAQTTGPGAFHHLIASDPTLQAGNPHISKFSRPIYQYGNPYPIPTIPTFGTFGFGFQNKGFPIVVQKIQEKYDEAIIKMHIGYSKFFDPTGAEARARIQESQSVITKPGIKIIPSHDFLTPLGLLQFLAANTANIFLYHEMHRGISSTIDYALAVKRPIIVNKTYMFRHLWNAKPSICIEDRTIPEIVASGFVPLQPFYDAWNPQNMANELTTIISRFS